MATTRKNKDFNPHDCPVTHLLNRIGGRWKILIIHCISLQCNRFSRLQRAIPMVSKQMLVNQLRELEEDGILARTIYPEIPPRVEYRLTAHGESLLPVIRVMQDWGLRDMQQGAAYDTTGS